LLFSPLLIYDDQFSNFGTGFWKKYFQVQISKLSIIIDFVEGLLYNLNTYMPKRGTIMKNLNKPTIIFSILYILIGAQYLIMGVVPNSRFFFYDNIIVRLGGAILLISSIGILLQKELARKGILAALLLLIIDLVIGIPVDYSTKEIVWFIIFALLLYFPGMLFLAFPESPIWRKLFGRFMRRSKENSSQIDSYEKMKTIKVMSITGIIILGVSLFFLFTAIGMESYVGAAGFGIIAILFALPYTIACLVISSKVTGKKTETDIFDNLLKLHGLKEKGILSEEEFEMQKQNILKNYN
jgi:hypothetical protein